MTWHSHNCNTNSSNSHADSVTEKITLMFLCTSYRYSYSVSNETPMTPRVVVQCRGVQAWYDSRDLGDGDTGSIAEERRYERAWNGAQAETPGLCTVCQWSAKEMQTWELDKNEFRSDKENVSNVC